MIKLRDEAMGHVMYFDVTETMTAEIHHPSMAFLYLNGVTICELSFEIDDYVHVVEMLIEKANRESLRIQNAIAEYKSGAD